MSTVVSDSRQMGNRIGFRVNRPVNQTDGKLAQPFFESSRNNTTTIYLSFSTSAEQLVDSLAPREKKP